MVPLPAVFDSASVPFAGRLFGSTHGLLSVQPGDVKPRFLVQSMEERDEAQDATDETWISWEKNVNCEGEVLGQRL